MKAGYKVSPVLFLEGSLSDSYAGLKQPSLWSWLLVQRFPLYGLAFNISNYCRQTGGLAHENRRRA